MPDDTSRPRSPGEAIFREARGAHEIGRSLLPLLSLLEEPEASGSLDEIKSLLKTIVAILGQHSEMLTEIQARVPAGPLPIGRR
ncbi:hypothetical protein [Aquabacter cavernae]|uniref:hypothetical protein n=1 Tax=Aquabacter cavernae TaxID=2496029 RepID=UPI000F8F22DF|nr:hypothetical protein [Aquabacter cavernae]